MHAESLHSQQTHEVRFKLHGIRKEGARYRTTKIAPVKELVRLSLAMMIFLSNRKPVKTVGKGNAFSTIQLQDKTSGSDF